MRLELDDKTLFGNDAGEDEDEQVLVSYFVDQPAFADFLDPRNRLWIVNGRKGTGKSALLARFAHAQRHAAGTPPPLVLQAVPSQLVALAPPPPTEDHVVLENHWKQTICGAINMALAREIGFAWNDNQMALVEGAELAGFAGRNLLGALVARLGAKLRLGGLEIAPQARPAANQEQLLQRIDRAGGTDRSVWFLLDDIDAKYQNTPGQQAFVSTFFSACRNLVRQTSGVGIRATVRTDVWASLTGAEDMDKVEQYRTEILWSASQQRRILAQRVLAWVRRHHPDSEVALRWNAVDQADELIELAFVGQMKWGASKAPADHVLRVLSGGRPRWLAQLCRMAGVNAVREGRDRIGAHHVTQAMGEFGRRRLADLYKEHGHQFAELRPLVEAFAGGPRRYTTAELTQRIEAQYLQRRGAGPVPAVDGAPFRDSLQLAKFLFKCGFVNGHNRERATLAVPEFVPYESRPDLLEAASNLDDGMDWELQPAYRNVLQVG